MEGKPASLAKLLVTSGVRAYKWKFTSVDKGMFAEVLGKSKGLVALAAFVDFGLVGGEVACQTEAGRVSLAATSVAASKGFFHWKA